MSMGLCRAAISTTGAIMLACGNKVLSLFAETANIFTKVIKQSNVRKHYSVWLPLHSDLLTQEPIESSLITIGSRECIHYAT